MRLIRILFFVTLTSVSFLVEAVDTTTAPDPEKSEISYAKEVYTHNVTKLQFAPNQGLDRTVVVHFWHKTGYLPAFTKNPLLILFPGRGVAALNYTVVASALAQKGYVVMAIDMPEIGHTVYPDGTIIRPSNAYSPGDLMRGPYEKVDQFFERAVSFGLEDIDLVIKQVKNPCHAMYDHIDFDRIGVLGHSLGGRIGGAFAANASNSVSAYASMEGIPPRIIRKNGMLVPQAHLVTEETYPYAKANYEMLLEGATTTVYLTQLQDMKHNSMLAKNKFDLDVKEQHNLEILINYLTLFYDQYVKEKQVDLLDFNHPQLKTKGRLE